MRAVFLDTVGLVAVWDSSDQWHAVAEAKFSELLRENVPLVATPHVLLECGNAAARRPYRLRVNALRHQLKNAGLLFELTADEHEQAWAAYDQNDAAAAGIVDQASFIIMRRLGVRDAFTNDAHFTAAGFKTVF